MGRKGAEIKNLQSNKLASWALRFGLALVLLYASVSSFVTPSDWIGYLPHFMTQYITGTMLLHIFSVYEFALALWLLSGYFLRLAALVSAATFAGIILTNLGVLAVTFRDVTMVFASLALAVLKRD